MAFADTALIETLTTHAESADAECVWPAASWAALQLAGGARWAIPAAYGGDGLHGIELLQRDRAGHGVLDHLLHPQPARRGLSPLARQ